jgi:endonuclease III
MKPLKQLKELEKLGKNIRLAAEEWKEEWQILISTVMSARTRDEVTIPIASKLFSKFNTIEKLAKANLKEVEDIIRPINFYKTKAKHILNCAKILVSEYKSTIPKDIEILIKLPGVGRKTANVFLSELGKAAIGIDTHLAYASRKLGWSKNKHPHKIEDDLKNLFPQNVWKYLNSIVVRFGKTYTSKKEKDRHLQKIKRIQ